MKQKQIKHAIFDWSGVIADTFDNWYFASSKVLEHFGHKKLSIKEARENFTQPYMLFYNKYLPSLKLKEQQEIYSKYITKKPKAKIFPGIKKMIMSIKKAGLELSILSGDREETLFPEMKAFKLDGIFDNIEYNVHNKARLINKLTKQSKYSPRESVFIGDTEHEVITGKKTGCQTCAVTWGFQPRYKLIKANPTYLVSTPQQLHKILLKT